MMASLLMLSLPVEAQNKQLEKARKKEYKQKKKEFSMTDKVLHINDDQFEQEVIGSDRPVFVDFWAPWCGPCRMVGPFIDELAEEMPNVKFVKIDIDKNTEVAAKLGVMSIPNMIVFKDGNIVNRQIGGLPKNELKAFIENCL